MLCHSVLQAVKAPTSDATRQVVGAVTRHAPGARQFEESKMTIESLSTLARWIDDKCPRPGQRGNPHRVPHSVLQKGGAKAAALKSDIDAEHSQKHSRNLLRRIPCEPSAGHIGPCHGMSTQRIEPGNLLAARNRVNDGGTPFPGIPRVLCSPSINNLVPAGKPVDSDAACQLNRF